MNFSNKTVIITGASSGIGAGAAKYLSSLGANLVLTGRKAENLKSVAGECEGQVLQIVGDLNNDNDRQKVISETLKKFKQIDCLVNNAGMGVFGEAATFSMKDFDLVMNTNVKSVFYLTQLAIPHLLKTKGNIVNISSVAGMRAFENASVYCMSKAAIDHFTRSLALELAATGVRVNAVNPAVIRTEFHRRTGMDEKTYAEYLEKSKTTHPMGRVGSVDETAKSIAFLACNEMSSFITGTTLAVDGGKAVMCPR